MHKTLLKSKYEMKVDNHFVACAVRNSFLSIQIYVISHVRLSGWQPVVHPFVCMAVLRSKNFYLEHCMQTFQPTSFISPMLLSIIEFCDFYSTVSDLDLCGQSKG